MTYKTIYLFKDETELMSEVHVLFKKGFDYVRFDNEDICFRKDEPVEERVKNTMMLSVFYLIKNNPDIIDTYKKGISLV